MLNDFAWSITNSRVVCMHAGSVGLRSMIGKNGIVDLPEYVPLEIFCHITGPIRSFVLPEEDIIVPQVVNS